MKYRIDRLFSALEVGFFAGLFLGICDLGVGRWVSAWSEVARLNVFSGIVYAVALYAVLGGLLSLPLFAFAEIGSRFFKFFPSSPLARIQFYLAVYFSAFLFLNARAWFHVFVLFRTPVFSARSFAYTGCFLIGAIVLGTVLSAVLRPGIRLLCSDRAPEVFGRFRRLLSPGLMIVSVVVLLMTGGPTRYAAENPEEMTGTSHPSNKPNRVFLIGLDGATFNLLLPWVRAGKLPNIEKLLARGTWGELRSFGRTSSPELWTSIATGKRPEKHKISFFTYHKKGIYEPQFLGSADRQALAIWNILSALDKKVCVIDWLMTEPPEPVNGVMVSRLSYTEQNKVYPQHLEDALNTALQTDREYARRFEHFLWSEDKWISETNRNLDNIRICLDQFLELEDWDFLALYTHDTDSVQHLFWKYMMPELYTDPGWGVTPEKVRQYGKVIEKTWSQVDTLIGEILATVDDRTTVILCSDHGQRPRTKFWVGLKMKEFMKGLGLAVYNEDGTQDYGASVAYLSGTDVLGAVTGINLNVKGREPHGIVEPEDFERMRDQVIEKFASIRVIEDDKPLFPLVCASNEEPNKELAVSEDDVYVHQGEITKLRSHGKHIQIGAEKYPLEQFFTPPAVSGMHSNRGIFLAAGPGVEEARVLRSGIETGLARAFRIANDQLYLARTPRLKRLLRRLHVLDSASVLDLVPTILQQLDLAVARDMDGIVIPNIYQVGAVADDSPPIETYEGAIPRPFSGEDSAPVVSSGMRERLRALGYLN